MVQYIATLEEPNNAVVVRLRHSYSSGPKLALVLLARPLPVGLT